MTLREIVELLRLEYIIGYCLMLAIRSNVIEDGEGRVK